MSGEQLFCNQLKQALNFYKIPLSYCSFCASYITLSPSEQFCVCTLSNRYKTSASKLFLVSSIALLTKVRSLLRRPLIRLIAATDSCNAFKAFRQSFSLEQMENKLQQARQLRWLRCNEVSISSFASTWLPRQKCIRARLLQASELLALISSAYSYLAQQKKMVEFLKNLSAGIKLQIIFLITDNVFCNLTQNWTGKKITCREQGEGLINVWVIVQQELQVSQLIIMSQANHKQSPATPMRYSSRHKIFSKRQSAQTSHRSTQQDEVYKLLAKIRSLQDDIRALIEKNQQLQIENHELMKMQNQTETAVAMQQAEILSITQRIQFQQSATENIIEYQRKLQEVGAQVSLLTELITHKNQKYQMLKFQKEKVVHQNLKLKEESNKFQYQEIQTEQKVDQLIDLFDPQRLLTLEDDLPQKIERIVDECRNLQEKIASKENVLENIRKEGAQAVMQEKEKQIQIQYNVRLLTERGRDVQQKSNYFASCYNQESIKAVIDDMLLKQNVLRKELDQQLQLNSAFQSQSQQALVTAKKRVQRERISLLQELKIQKMENEMQLKKKQRAEADYKMVASQTLPLQQESTQISQQVIQENAEIYNRIKMLQSQNIDLQMSLASANEEILLLRRQLNI